MDTTPDAARARAEDARFEGVDLDEPGLRAAQRVIVRRFLWSVAWGVPIISLIVGIWLTGAGTIEQWTPAGDDVFDVTLLAVWPAGLVLLAVGALGVVASAITAVVLTTDR